MSKLIERVPFLSNIVLLAIILVIIGGSCNSGQPTEPKQISGYEVYRVRCVNCHGANGRAGLNGAKQLPDSPLSVKQRVEVVTNGQNNVMPAFKTLLSKAEIEAVAKYTMELK